VEDILYKIHVSMLVKLSPDMGSILRYPGWQKDWRSNRGDREVALASAGLTVQEFEDFLTWVYRADQKTASGLRCPTTKGANVFTTNLLKVSDLWQIEVGRPTRLSGYQIFDGRISDLSLIDIGRIGTKVYSVLVNGMERMEMEIRRTANVEPPLTADPDWQCQKHAMCAAAWKQLWWDKLGRKLLHPDHPIKTDAILAEAKKMVHKDLNERCRQDVLQQMERNIVFVDKRVIAAVAAAIVDYHKTL
ncbi:hypothetical protein FB451DRAFT_1195939, partial [Mycena latifolia]